MEFLPAMSYCLNPHCQERLNPDNYKFCQSCGTQLLLRNRYQAVQFLGSGGFGRTFLAVDRDCMNVPCVVKQFSPLPDIQADPSALRKATELFNHEAVQLLQLGEHPQIPRLLAYFEQDKYLYLVQEFIDGQDLYKELAIEGTFDEPKIRQLLTELLPVLQFIHGKGVIHRDIKPENIMRRRQDGKLMLIDFGVSKQATGTGLGRVGTTVGTAGFTPLEQMRGKAYPASDLYSLGVTCICLLTNSLPHTDSSDEIYNDLECRWMWREHLPSGTSISPQLEQIIDKLLQDLPKDRYQSASEVLQALNSASTVPEVTEPPLPEPLVSATGVDYTQLSQLLAAENWKEADVETRLLLLKVVDREQEGWLRAEDFKTFPCEDLYTIDRLWVDYSKGRFGFSVQKEIWESVKGKIDNHYTDWCRFGDKVGWRVNGNWLTYSELTFNLDTAPLGHLPAGGLDNVVLGKWDLVCCSLASRLEVCNIDP